MLAAIGETFETPLPPLSPSETPEQHEPSPDLITGVILSTRPNFYRLAIWTRSSPGPESEAATDDLLKRITMIGKHFKTAVLGFGEDDRLVSGYQTEVEWIKHSDSEKKDKKVRFESLISTRQAINLKRISILIPVSLVVCPKDYRLSIEWSI